LRDGQQFELVAAGVEVNPGEARLQSAVVFDTNGVDSRRAVITSVIAGLRGGFIRAIVVAVHVVVVTRTGGGNGELRVAGSAGVVGLDRDDKIITFSRIDGRNGHSAENQHDHESSNQA
jgi:hypothetical protein